MTDLVDTTEMYLRTIIDLEEEGIPPFRARISERLGHSGPTVSQTVARMERDGLLVVEADRQLALTKQGRQKAIEVTRKHRLAERLLADVIGLDWSLVHEEACRWEHVMSEQVERKLIAMLGRPTESPYGNPIPAMEDIGGPKAEKFLTGVIRVTDFATVEPKSGILRRLGEPAQVDPEVLKTLHQAGVIPGARITVSVIDAGFRLETPGPTKAVVVPEELAHHLYLAA
jgi:DtxR family transcriptional regulator, Mn-dependent transcriptional regulator